MELYLQTNSVDSNGDKCALLSQQLEHKLAPMYHHLHGLSYTATGYGSRLPTQYMVKVVNRWRRVYCVCFSNVGTLYIGNLSDNQIIKDY